MEQVGRTLPPPPFIGRALSLQKLANRLINRWFISRPKWPTPADGRWLIIDTELGFADRGTLLVGLRRTVRPTTHGPRPYGMKKALLSVLGVLLCAILHGQTGTEFWLAPPDVTYYHNTPGDQPIYLNVAAGNAAATVTVSQPANAGFNGGAPIVLNLAANSAVRYDLTALKAQLETRPTNSVRNTGLLIQSTANITCYYERIRVALVLKTQWVPLHPPH